MGESMFALSCPLFFFFLLPLASHHQKRGKGIKVDAKKSVANCIYLRPIRTETKRTCNTGLGIALMLLLWQNVLRPPMRASLCDDDLVSC